MQLPDQIQKLLNNTHLKGIPAVKNAGFTPERVDVALAIEKHRWFWKPDKVRLILVGESHVYTTDSDLSQQLDVRRIVSLLKDTPFDPGLNQPDPISEYVGLVYCLGYGEPSLRLPKTSIHSGTVEKKRKHSGTPQYWNQIFGRLAGTLPPGKGVDKIPWKIKTLGELYRKGIWLLDASVHAIYHGSEGAITGKNKMDLHIQWWEGYGRHLLKPGNDVHVWVIGKTTYDTLAEYCPDFTRLCDGWIYQPNARVKTEKREQVLKPLLDLSSELPDSPFPGKADFAY